LVTLLNIVIDPIIFDTVMDGLLLRSIECPIFGAQVELVILATTFLSIPGTKQRKLT